MKPIVWSFVAAIVLMAVIFVLVYWQGMRMVNSTLELVDESNAHCQSKIGVTAQYTVEDYKRDTGMSQEQFVQQQAECHKQFMEANQYRLAK
ncbi:MAG: hypothetical protein EP312_07165 [Gammaproteobacteria bacterium]|nr:MAG: hypothetical protein EP312_07165 [Gammaproteobacteria bacterium]